MSVSFQEPAVQGKAKIVKTNSPKPVVTDDGPEY